MLTDGTHAPRRGRRAAAFIAAAAMLVGLSASPAGAAPEDVSAPVTGSLTINGGASPFAPDSVYFTGTFDPETGDLVGGFTFPPGTTTTDLATVQRTVAASGAGSVDLDTGVVTFGGTLVITLTSITIEALEVEDQALNACRYVAELALTGTFDAATGAIDVGEDGFAIIVDPTAPADRCFPPGPLAALVNGGLDDAVTGTENALAAAFDVGVNQVPPPPVPPVDPPAPPVDPPAPPPAAPPAAPVTAQPTFAG